MSKPLYTHDCDLCTYIGSFEYLGAKVDAYESCDGSHAPYSVRYSSEGSDYVTIFDERSPMYDQCAALVAKRGDALFNVRKMCEEALEEREAILEQLGKISMRIVSYRKEISKLERNTG